MSTVQRKWSTREASAGTSLLEMLVYIVCLAVAINVAAQVVLTCTRLSSYGTNMADRYAAAHDVETVFVDAVREAWSIVPSIGNYQTGPSVLVIETAPNETSQRRFIVLGCFKPERLSRIEFTESNGVLTPESIDTLPLDLAELSFAFGSENPGDARSVTLYYRIKTPRGRDVQADPRYVEASLRTIGSGSR